MSENINLTTSINIDGKEYFISPAQTLAKKICAKDYDTYRLTKEDGFISSTIFYERIIQKGSCFVSAKYAAKKEIGVLYWDVNKSHIVFRKDIQDVKKHEFKADMILDDYFYVFDDIYKLLRDEDLIEIRTFERKIRHKEKFVYRILKKNAEEKGFKKIIDGIGTMFFIPKTAFVCVKYQAVPKRTRNWGK